MCDLFSWIESRDNETGEVRIYFNTDEDIEIAGMSFVDGIGHSAIEKIWKVAGEHKEGLLKVPKELAEAVNRGKCVKMVKAGGAAGVHYNIKAGVSYGEIDAPWWPKALIEEAKILKYFDNHAESLPEWRMFENKDAAWTAARGAARGAAKGAAWTAASDAARAASRGSARGAAYNAAYDAAWGAAWDAASNAVMDASSDAALVASCIVAFYGKKKNKHLTYAKKRWEVWQRGYGCLCDVGGVLYCYKRP